ncbi:uncharacterized protein TM35_000113440 [Trypanosoma theileri]|uniref:Uncharacterized protein n=1 Tax=Trypanosoma theileri TaxID=67003 RepID=A0A1X0P081_9TRYP|nr:uncharacterized protein TM35_000113440 [Trypanosoma theileri]ORC89810.1 hypothetical protein TM35_000113440 [Trypanosoma theileri]
MWRLNYAMYGDVSLGRYFSPAERRIPLSANLHCTHVSRIFRYENSNSNSSDNYTTSTSNTDNITSLNSGSNSECCFLTATSPPHGRLLALTVKGSYAEMREAQVHTHNPSQTTHLNGEEPRRCRVSRIPAEKPSLHNTVNVDTEEEEEEENNNEDECLVPLYTTAWRHVSSTLVLSADVHEPIHRLRHYSRDERTLSALAVDAVHQLHVEPLVHSDVFEFDRASVNATAMDYWGPNSVVIGFSSGELCVLDWRDPSGGLLFRSSASSSLSSLQRSISLRRRSPPVGGIMSCCALEDSFRVVCGLGDSHGTVVVTDLRKGVSVSRDTMKRGRKSFADEIREAVVSERVSIPTGYPVCDMRHCRLEFGVIGMVDTGGMSVLTTIAELESGTLKNKPNNKNKNNIYNNNNNNNNNININNNNNNNNSDNDNILSLLNSASPERMVFSEETGGGRSVFLHLLDRQRTSIPHRRNLRCDISPDGSFLMSTGVRCCGAAVRTWDGKLTDLEFTGVEDEVPFREYLKSISLMDSMLCAETENGNALCAAVHMS